MGLPVEKKDRYTLAEYLEMEKSAVEKHEFNQGQLRMMSGGTVNHSLIITNTIGSLCSILKGKPCRSYDSNLRIRIPRKTIYTYPDISVICGKVQLDPEDSTQQTATNPRLLVEVLSPSTEAYDRGEKFNYYRQIDSLEEYVLISQDRAMVETFFKQSDGIWLFSAFSGQDSKAPLRCLSLDLTLADIYDGADFSEPPILPSASA